MDREGLFLYGAVQIAASPQFNQPAPVSLSGGFAAHGQPLPERQAVCTLQQKYCNPVRYGISSGYQRTGDEQAHKGAALDITRTIEEMKKEPGFAEQVGMILVHNGIVRAWSRKDRSAVATIDVSANNDKIRALADEYSKKPGIYKIIIEAQSGRLKPGEDLLFIVVAGDIRENVKPVLSELLDRVKSEAVYKTEYPA